MSPLRPFVGTIHIEPLPGVTPPCAPGDDSSLEHLLVNLAHFEVLPEADSHSPPRLIAHGRVSRRRSRRASDAVVRTDLAALQEELEQEYAALVRVQD
jgi:hypothetical protein